MTTSRLCKAKKSNGQPCGRYAIHGAEVCPAHGGRAPQVRAAAARRFAIEAATAQVARFGGRIDISPADALLELVSTKAAEVAYWERIVADLDAEALTWGITKRESGTDRDMLTDITTLEARKNINLDLLHAAQRDLAAFAAAALKGGVDRALVQIAQTQAVQLVEVLRSVLADTRVTVAGEPEAVILDALKGKGLAA